MHPIPLNLVFENQISEFVMIKLARKANQYFISNSYSEGGLGYIKKNIGGFNEASKGCLFFVLTDLDTVDCAPALMEDWLREAVHPNLIFRIAVREVEAWLLADIHGFSKYTGISKTNFHDKPEEIADPKAELLHLIKRCRKRKRRTDIIKKALRKLSGQALRNEINVTEAEILFLVCKSFIAGNYLTVVTYFILTDVIIFSFFWES